MWLIVAVAIGSSLLTMVVVVVLGMRVVFTIRAREVEQHLADAREALLSAQRELDRAVACVDFWWTHVPEDERADMAERFPEFVAQMRARHQLQ